MSGPSSIVHCAKMRPSMKSWQSWAPVCKRFNATSQRNGWREVRSRARSSIGGKQTTFGTPTRSTYADRASLKLTPAELAPLSHDIPRKCAPAKDLRSIYSRVVNWAGTRVITLGRVTYAGEDRMKTYGNAPKRPCSCQYGVNGWPRACRL